MCAKLLVPLLFLVAVPIATGGTVLVIDDFTDPARIAFPDGPESVVTQGVGDLSAERVLNAPRSASSTIASAEIGSGDFMIDVDDAGEVTRFKAAYHFPRHDFTPYEAVRIDISVFPPPSTDPGVPSIPGFRVGATDAQDNFLHWNISGIQPGRLILPLDSFASRPSGGDWSQIDEFEMIFGAASIFGPWEVTVDHVSFGPIPEPTTICLLTGCVGWLLFTSYLRRRGNYVS